MINILIVIVISLVVFALYRACIVILGSVLSKKYKIRNIDKPNIILSIVIYLIFLGLYILVMDIANKYFKLTDLAYYIGFCVIGISSIVWCYFEWSLYSLKATPRWIDQDMLRIKKSTLFIILFIFTFIIGYYQILSEIDNKEMDPIFTVTSITIVAIALALDQVMSQIYTPPIKLNNVENDNIKSDKDKTINELNFSYFFSWISNHKILMISVLLFLIIGIPFLIHICFIIQAPTGFLKTEFEAGNILEYYGSVLGFIGTVILSVLALWQNHVIKNEVDKREALLVKMEKEKNLPILRCSNYGCNGTFANIELKLDNVSDNIANDIKIENFVVEDSEGRIGGRSHSVSIDKAALTGNDFTIVRFSNEEIYGKNLCLSFYLTCRDKFNDKHKYNFISKIEDTKHFSKDYEYKVIEMNDN